MARQTKTPRERAEEAFALANRKVVRLDKDVDRLATELAAKRRELEEAIALRDHAAAHPALPAQPEPATPVTDTTQEGTNP